MTILFLCKQVKHGIIYWLYEETCVFFIFAVSMKTCLKNYKLRRIRDEKVAKQRKTEKKIETKVNLSVCVCGGGWYCFTLTRRTKTVWWKYACSSDSDVPMTTVVLGDIGGDIPKSQRVARMHIKWTHAHTSVPSAAWLSAFSPKGISVFPCSPAHSSSCVCSSSFNSGGLSLLKFSASQMTNI